MVLVYILIQHSDYLKWELLKYSWSLVIQRWINVHLVDHFIANAVWSISIRLIWAWINPFKKNRSVGRVSHHDILSLFSSLIIGWACCTRIVMFCSWKIFRKMWFLPTINQFFHFSPEFWQAEIKMILFSTSGGNINWEIM